MVSEHVIDFRENIIDRRLALVISISVGLCIHCVGRLEAIMAMILIITVIGFLSYEFYR